MRKGLRISDALTLPISAITEVIGILALRGVGKTYTELKMAEEFVKAGLQIISLDSMGVFWGLRASADGKGPGLPVTIMGGDHADVPLVPTAGKVVAAVLAGEPISAILDISDFRKNEQRRFVADFLDEFYHLKKQHPTPVHLFLDEADLWAPQQPDKGWEVMLGAMQDIVRRGRARGIGCTMATQRSAVLSKSVLSQISVLVAMQMTSPHDIDAADYWVKSTATREGREAFLKAVPTLQKGEAFVWSPAWLKIMKRIKIARRETFDSSRTPEVGEKIRAPKTLATVDIAKLKKAIEATVELDDSTRTLKQRVAGLLIDVGNWKGRANAAEGRLEEARKAPQKPAAPAARPAPAFKVIEKEIAVVGAGELTRLEKALETARRAAGKCQDAATHLRGFSDLIQQRIEEVDRKAKKADVKAQETRILVMHPPNTIAMRPVQEVRTREGFRGHIAGPLKMLPKEPGPATDLSQLKLRAGEKGMLQALWRLGHEATFAKVGMLSGFPPTQPTFGTYLGVLKRHQLVTVSGEVMTITQAGAGFVPDHNLREPKRIDEIAAMWKARLRAGERRLLDVLIDRNGKPAGYNDVMSSAGIETETTFNTYVGVLKRLGLAETEGGQGITLIRASKALLGE